MAPPTTGDRANEAKSVSSSVSGDGGRPHENSDHSGSGQTSPPEDSKNLVELMTELFGPSNGVDLELPAREPMRDPPTFD